MEDPDLEEEDSGIICDAGEDDMDIALDDLLDEGKLIAFANL